MALISLENVSKGYFANREKSSIQVALSGLDLSIEEGEFVSLLGPSGCGKTVTLNMIAGFELPSMGTVKFKGEPITSAGPERGVVFQEYSLLPWLSVQENLEYALKSNNVPKAQRRKRCEDALELVNLQAHADKRPNLLSGGMKQRVAIARLFAMDSDVFLMDEPFSALDEQTRDELDAGVFNLWKNERKTIVFVTHSISEAIRVSSRIVLYSPSPGRVIKQWILPEDMARNEDEPAVKELRDEIRSLLPSRQGSGL